VEQIGSLHGRDLTLIIGASADTTLKQGRVESRSGMPAPGADPPDIHLWARNHRKAL